MKANQRSFPAIISLFFLFSNNIMAQQEAMEPKNYISVFGGVEWNTTSAAAGLEYERAVYKGKQLLFSFKGLVVLPYKYGNAALLSHSDGSRSVLKMAVMATGNFFTGAYVDKNGFYFCASSGLGVVTDKYRIDNGTYSQFSILRFSAETGAGIQLRLSDNTALRLSGSVLWGMLTGGYTIARVSVGF
jgi:hypothetical protein